MFFPAWLVLCRNLGVVVLVLCRNQVNLNRSSTIRVRLLNGQHIQRSFAASEPLSAVADWILIQRTDLDSAGSEGALVVCVCES